MPASLAYNGHGHGHSGGNETTNPAPFLLTPILNLPPSFGSAYVGETFSCTLCANHDVAPPPADAAAPAQQQQEQQQEQRLQTAPRRKFIRDVRIEAEMKTPGSGSAVQKLVLGPRKRGGSSSSGGGKDAEGGDDNDDDDDDDEDEEGKEDDKQEKEEADKGTDLAPGQTLQRIVNFDLKEEGNHVLAVTVSYYEATETSGRTRTFRKLYQFICKGSLIVRTKVSPLPRLLVPPSPAPGGGGGKKKKKKGKGEGEAGTEKPPPRTLRSWAMEAQLENCSEDIMQLERVGLDLEPGLRYVDCNWDVGQARSPPGRDRAVLLRRPRGRRGRRRAARGDGRRPRPLRRPRHRLAQRDGE